MPISHAEYIQMKQRVISNRKNPTISAIELSKAVELEKYLHEQIINHCNSQWPRWKFIHARMDQRSTIEKGAQDFTIFVPSGRVLCIECKAGAKKLEPEQLAWKLEMERLSHEVHTVRSIEEFHRIANQVTTKQHDDPRSDPSGNQAGSSQDNPTARADNPRNPT